MLRSLSIVSNNEAKDLRNENERNKSPKKKNKANAWTEDEHKLFLVGLAKHGKGKWKNISLEFVKSRSPSQVASHAQKYFKRLNSSTNKEKRRSSIFDITIVPDERDVGVLHGGNNIMVDETINLQSGERDELFPLSDFIDYPWEDYWFELPNFENLPIL